MVASLKLFEILEVAVSHPCPELMPWAVVSAAGVRYSEIPAHTIELCDALNDVLSEATIKVQPPSDKGKRLKIYYMTQISVAPPTFVIFCNDAELFHFSYQRYIENCLRQTFGFKGTPIKLIIRMKGEDAK